MLSKLSLFNSQSTSLEKQYTLFTCQSSNRLDSQRKAPKKSQGNSKAIPASTPKGLCPCGSYAGSAEEGPGWQGRKKGPPVNSAVGVGVAKQQRHQHDSIRPLQLSAPHGFYEDNRWSKEQTPTKCSALLCEHEDAVSSHVKTPKDAGEVSHCSPDALT